MERNPELAKKIVEAGHGLYSHGYDHIRLSELSKDEIVVQISKAEASVRPFQKRKACSIMRLPFRSGHDDPKVQEVLETLNPPCRLVEWTLTPREWTYVERIDCRNSVSTLGKTAVGMIAGLNWHGGIILIHDWGAVNLGSKMPDYSQFRPDFCGAILTECLMIAHQKRLRLTPLDPDQWA